MKENKRLLTFKEGIIDPKHVNKMLKDKMGIRIDLGCGGKKQSANWVGIDYRERPGVDIVHNLENPPFPLPTGCASIVLASHVVEHLNPHGGVFIDFMNEAWRLLKDGGEFFIAAPYATSPGMFRDPTHCNFISEETWLYFDPEDIFYKGGLYNVYSPLPWQIKVNTWQDNGNLETILVKRPVDKRFCVDEYYLEVLNKHTKETKKYEKK